MDTATLISTAIAVICAIITSKTVIQGIWKVKNSKNVTFIKKDGSKLTVNTHYNPADSRKVIEFMK